MMIDLGWRSRGAARIQYFFFPLQIFETARRMFEDRLVQKRSVKH